MDREALRKAIREYTEFTFARSGGKGGQNVNKVSTKAHGMLPVSRLRGLSGEELAEVLRKLAGKINAQQVICIDVDDERFQDVNRAIALARLENWISTAALLRPKRRKTKPSRSARERRLQGKKRHSDIKRQRAWRGD